KGFGNWLAKDWQRVGLDKPVVSVEQFSTTSTSESIDVEIHFRHRYGDATTGEIRSVVRYRVYPEGKMEVKASFSVKGQLPDLPRAGMKWMLAGDLRQLEWYGLGPHDSYSDRKASVNKGLWTSRVEDQYTPWPRPQHSGNKEEVKWVRLKNVQAGRLAPPNRKRFPVNLFLKIRPVLFPSAPLLLPKRNWPRSCIITNYRKAMPPSCTSIRS
ncbi:MAG: hypothetical protein LWW91_10645, partial [Bacteroidales bacterium]|nr:hypothetical protein [Bacteroidales bacterium]